MAARDPRAIFDLYLLYLIRKQPRCYQHISKGQWELLSVQTNKKGQHWKRRLLLSCVKITESKCHLNERVKSIENKDFT